MQGGLGCQRHITVCTAVQAVQTPRRVGLRSVCHNTFRTQQRHLFRNGPKRTAPSLPGVTAGLPHDSSDKRAETATTESSGWVMQTIRRYPISFAFGSLFLVFVLPNVMTIGLVGIERTALAFLLALEELLVAVFLAGAKWVALAATAAGMLALVWFETKKRRF